MGKHTVKRGEAQLRTGSCIVCAATTFARTYSGSTVWYVPMFCHECVEYRIRVGMSKLFPQPKVTHYRNCLECGVRFIPSKNRVVRCSIVCRSKAQRKWASTHDRRKANKHIRRARERDARFERVSQQAVINRDGLRCHLCLKDVNLRTKVWAKRATLDHVIPLSQGGTHTMNNLRLAHMACNVSRGKVGAAQPLLL